MKKRKKLLLILLLIIAALGVFAYWQRDNLNILLQAGKYTTQELETKMDENQRSLQDAVDSRPGVAIREPTEEEIVALKNGLIAPEELAKSLVEAQEPADALSADLSALIARVLLLQKLYVGKLEGLEAEAKAEYRGLSESQRAELKLVEWASGYIKRATEMEKQCDIQIDGVVAEMLELIGEYDGDTEIADKVVYSYAEEKRLKKAWYLSRLEERGLLG